MEAWHTFAAILCALLICAIIVYLIGLPWWVAVVAAIIASPLFYVRPQ